MAGLENKREIFEEHLCVAWLLGHNTVAKERSNEKGRNNKRQETGPEREGWDKKK